MVEEAVDGGLQIDHGLKDAAIETALGVGREEASTALSQEGEVGAKWNVQRRWRAAIFTLAAEVVANRLRLTIRLPDLWTALWS
jgi:hypothetical protein